ncbi:MAG: TlpA family protein disulfide reductase, partial [Mangrovimonas sp.]|nr:TlpA family protein disulfide reductase [Mangrovimonas sp.]
GMPKMKELQESKQEIVYVFLSLDKSIDSWKKGIEKYKVEGEHYFMKSGWDGPFGTFLDLDWIPRYLVIDEVQNIKIFKEIKVNKNLKNSLP